MLIGAWPGKDPSAAHSTCSQVCTASQNGANGVSHAHKRRKPSSAAPPSQSTRQAAVHTNGVARAPHSSSSRLENVGRFTFVPKDLPDAAFEDTQSPVPALQGLVKTLAALQPVDQRQLLQHPSVRKACTAAHRALHRVPEQDLCCVVSTLAALQEAGPNADVRGCLAAAKQQLQHRFEQGRDVSVPTLCQALAAFARSEGSQPHPSTTLVDAIFGSVLSSAVQLSPRQQANVLGHAAKLKFAKRNQPATLRAFSQCLAEADGLEAPHLNRLLQVAAARQDVPKSEMQALAGHLERVVHGLSAVDLFEVVSCYHNYKLHPPGLYTAVAAALAPKLTGLQLNQVSRLLYLYQAPRVPPGRPLLVAAEQLLLDMPSPPHGRTLAGMMWAFVRLQHQPRQATLELTSRWTADYLLHPEQELGDNEDSGLSLRPRDLASMFWAYGSLHFVPPEIDTLCQGLEASLAGTNALDVSQVLTGLAGMFSEREKGQTLPLRLLHLLEVHACSLLPTFSPMVLSRAVWGYGKLGVPVPQLLPLAVQAACAPLAAGQAQAAGADQGQSLPNTQSVGRGGRWNLRDLVDLLWACARLDLVPDVASPLAARILELLPTERGSGQDMALLAWSAGTLRQGQLVEAAILHLPGHTVSRLQNVDLCHLLWAVAHMNVAVEPELLLRFSERLADLQATLTPRERGTLLWSYGNLRCYPGQALMEALCSVASGSLSTYDTQAVCHVLYGCGALRHDPGSLLQAVVGDMLRRPQAYDQRDWVRILWAFGTLNFNPGEQLFNALYRQMQKGTIQLNAVVVGMSLWCLAISQALQHPLYELLMTALERIPAEEFDTPGLQRICTAHLYACGLGKSSSAGLPPGLRSAAREGLQSALAEDVTWPRNSVRSVAAALQSLGVAGRMDASLANGLWQVHILLNKRDQHKRPVVVELLPNNRLLRNSQRLGGHEALRVASLQAWGYSVITVPCSEWLDMDPTDSPAFATMDEEDAVGDAREQYLLDKLRVHFPDLGARSGVSFLEQARHSKGISRSWRADFDNEL